MNTKLTGFRTLIVNLVLLFAGIVGVQISPELVQHNVTIVMTVFGAINILMRTITKGPFGQNFPALDTFQAAISQLAANVNLHSSTVEDLNAVAQTLLNQVAPAVAVVSPAPVPAPAPAPSTGMVMPGIAALGKVATGALLIGIIGGGLVGCSAVDAKLQAVTPPAPKTPAQAVYEVKAALIVGEDAALTWMKQVCPVQATCADDRVTAVGKGFLAADDAINAAEKSVQDTTTSSTVAQQAVTDAQNALQAFQAILGLYGIKATSTTGSAP